MPQGLVLGLLLLDYLLYTSPVVDIIHRHNLNFHFYVNDSQLLSFKGADRLFDSKLQLNACINNICHWMVFNELKLNQDKTELLIMNSRYCFYPSLSCLPVGDVDVDPVKASSNLGVVFDDTTCMSFKSHVCKSFFHHLVNISRINKYLTRKATEMVVHAFVTSKLDYCNSLLYGLPIVPYC